MDAFIVVLLSLACFRISKAITREDGPMDIFSRIRFLTGTSAHESKLKKSIADLVSCPYCIGIWIAFLLWYVYILIPRVSLLLIVPFALAGIQSIIMDISDRLTGEGET